VNVLAGLAAQITGRPPKMMLIYRMHSASYIYNIYIYIHIGPTNRRHKVAGMHRNLISLGARCAHMSVASTPSVAKYQDPLTSAGHV
jgi:hypothetical protein